MKGKTINFDKIIAMCDNMVKLIAQEQQDDTNKEMCEALMKERTTKMKEALATVDWISSLHKDCDWR